MTSAAVCRALAAASVAVVEEEEEVDEDVEVDWKRRGAERRRARRAGAAAIVEVRTADIVKVFRKKGGIGGGEMGETEKRDGDALMDG